MATATATAVSLSSLVDQRVSIHFEHRSFVVLHFRCTVEEGVMGTVQLWTFDIKRTEDNSMMILAGDTMATQHEKENGEVYYRVKLD